MLKENLFLEGRYGICGGGWGRLFEDFDASVDDNKEGKTDCS